MPIPIVSHNTSTMLTTYLASVTVIDGGYLCMSTNNSLSFNTGELTSPSSSLSLEGLARAETTPSSLLLSSPSLSFSSFSHFTHQIDYNRNGVSRSSNIATRRQSFKSSISINGVVPGHEHWRLKKKRQRQEHVPPWQQFTRAEFPGG